MGDAYAKFDKHMGVNTNCEALACRRLLDLEFCAYFVFGLVCCRNTVSFYHVSVTTLLYIDIQLQ